MLFARSLEFGHFRVSAPPWDRRFRLSIRPTRGSSPSMRKYPSGAAERFKLVVQQTFCSLVR